MGSKSKSNDQKPSRRSRKRKLRTTVQDSLPENIPSQKAGTLDEEPSVKSPELAETSLEALHHGDGQLEDENTSKPTARPDEREEESRSPHQDGLDQDQNSLPKEDATKSLDPHSDEAAEEAFKKFYLRKVTEELAEDLDKARSASDFSERSLPILIEALQQGVKTFSKEERIRIGRIGVGIGQS
ncbi:MAG: cell separation during budding [Bathelium mastoideum]|nr:MAG: cell separation during budding [Bathelium mastoideum]